MTIIRADQFFSYRNRRLNYNYLCADSFSPTKAKTKQAEWQLKPYKTYCSNLQICKVDGNHWAFLVVPESFNKAILQFLSKLQSELGDCSKPA